MGDSAFIDWCPRAIGGLETIAYPFSSSADWKSELLNHNRGLRFPLRDEQFKIAKIEGAYRLDGIFIFKITWDGDPPAFGEEINIASLVSHYLKNIMGHTHLYNKNKSSVIKSAEQRQFIVHPIKLDLEKVPKANKSSDKPEEVPVYNFCEILCSPADLYSLVSLAPPGRAPLRVLPLLRAGYSKLFDNTFSGIRVAKRKAHFGVRVFGDHVFKFFAFLLVCLGFALHKAAGNGPNTMAIWIVGALETVALVILVRLVLAFMKKRPDLQALAQRAKTFLNWGVTKDAQLSAKYAVLGHFDVKRLWQRAFILFFLFAPFFLSTFAFHELVKSIKVGSWILYSLGSSGQNANLQPLKAAFGRGARLPEYLLEIVAFAAAPFFLIVFALDVSVKRRHTLRLLRYLRGHLLFGNVLNVIIENAVRKANASVYGGGGFDHAIRIVDDHVNLEKRKRNQAFAFLLLPGVTSIAYIAVVVLGITLPIGR